MTQSDDTTRPLFVRLPASTADQLDAAAAARGASKRQLVTELLGQGLGLRIQQPAMGHGHASVIPSGGDVLTLDEAAELLKVGVGDLVEAAESAQVPVRRIGSEWRFSRSALLAWLGADESASAVDPHAPSHVVGRAVGFAAPVAVPDPPAMPDDAPIANEEESP